MKALPDDTLARVADVIDEVFNSFPLSHAGFQFEKL
jgi:hypothetical protein